MHNNEYPNNPEKSSITRYLNILLLIRIRNFYLIIISGFLSASVINNELQWPFCFKLVATRLDQDPSLPSCTVIAVLKKNNNKSKVHCKVQLLSGNQFSGPMCITVQRRLSSAFSPILRGAVGCLQHPGSIL